MLFLELATDSLLEQPDQNAFLEICTEINRNKHGPRIALDDIINRLEQTAENDPKAACLTLLLLEWCVKRCGYRFTRKLCKVDYLKRLRRLFEDKCTAIGVQKKLLGLIQFQSPQLHEVPRLSIQTSAADVEATQDIVQDVRHDLRLTTLDLPAVEAVFRDSPNTPLDPAVLRQLQVSHKSMPPMDDGVIMTRSSVSLSLEVLVARALLTRLIPLDRIWGHEVTALVEELRVREPSFEQFVTAAVASLVTTDHLEELQRRLLARIRLSPRGTGLGAATNPDPETTLHESPNQMKNTVCERPQPHNSHERMQLREADAEKKTRGLAVESTTTIAAASSVVTATHSSSSATTAATSPANTTASAHLPSTQKEELRQTIALTLSQAADDIKGFQMCLGAVREDPAPIPELGYAARSLQLLRQKLAFLIEDWSTILGDFAGVATEEDEATLASLMQTNDEVLSSLGKYEELINKSQHGDDEVGALYDFAVCAVRVADGACGRAVSERIDCGDSRFSTISLLRSASFIKQNNIDLYLDLKTNSGYFCEGFYKN
ncbi:unnamed protein product [Schistocephalus solidus]|uniref:VHS domain-containing protein n=1 Tax=Schistocephalus solidus TaxID=70667 RepID=A0A183T1K1_SCHSO|nr:unnamed protein product [Schistocephalus solidus]